MLSEYNKWNFIKLITTLGCETCYFSSPGQPFLYKIYLRTLRIYLHIQNFKCSIIYWQNNNRFESIKFGFLAVHIRTMNPKRPTTLHDSKYNYHQSYTKSCLLEKYWHFLFTTKNSTPENYLYFIFKSEY